MPVSLVDLARRAVVRTNQWPGLEALYRRAYDLGLSFVVDRLGSVPGVLAVLLRANDDGKSWTPGLSDYDLSVLIEHHDGPRTLRVLDVLWRRYRSIKRFVPQLGEMEVMNVDEFEDFLSFGPLPTSSVKRAYPLFVRPGRPDVDRVLQRRSRPSGEPEMLLDALSRFSRFAYPAWLDDARSNGVTRRRAAHLLENVSKRLTRLGVPAETTANGAIADRILLVFRDLSQACSLMKPGEGDPAALIAPDVSSLSADALLPIKTFCERTLRRAAVHRCSAVVWISYMSADRLNLVFVVPDDIAPDELRRLLATLRTERDTAAGLLTTPSREDSGARRPDQTAFPTVASESMWRCWRELSPFSGAAVAANGRTIVGETDRLHAAPSTRALRRGAEVHYAALLALKNNWRLWRGRPPGEAYVPFVNLAKGCASAFTGQLQIVPAALEFPSTQDGYLAAIEALRVLRVSLGS
jgi:hypothetical protein